jgi:hypothetical protein
MFKLFLILFFIVFISYNLIKSLTYKLHIHKETIKYTFDDASKDFLKKNSSDLQLSDIKNNAIFYQDYLWSTKNNNYIYDTSLDKYYIIDRDNYYYIPDTTRYKVVINKDNKIKILNSMKRVKVI